MEFDKNKLQDMIAELKSIEANLESKDWEEDEDKIYRYNELQDEILDYLKGVL